ncbi:MAG: DUF1700 domain-containing protein [Eubacteriales bacterium]|nr:DUF1700 domain-containing protein [Eubacteriales bacterium]
MDRAQFMGQLKKLLSDISEAERQEALDYYESYFDDAGEENEADVIRELGSPGKVAAIIKADLKESNDRYAEYTELGYEDSRTREPGQVPDKYTAVAAGENKAHNGNAGQDTGQNNASGGTTGQKDGRFTGSQGSYSNAGTNGSQGTGGRKFGRERAAQGGAYTGSQGSRQRGAYDAGREQSRTYGPGNQEPGSDRSRSRAERGYHADKKKNKGGIILILILLVFISPFIKGAVGGALGVIITIALFPFLLVFGLGAGALGLIIGAIACVGAGIGLCFTSPAAGILTIGIGCILMAIGILFAALLVWVAGKVLPKLLQKFTDFCYNLLHREKKGGADV